MNLENSPSTVLTRREFLLLTAVWVAGFALNSKPKDAFAAANPVGNIEIFDGRTGYLGGWAKQQDSKKPILVRCSIEREGKIVAHQTKLADLKRNDVGPHGWETALPPNYRGKVIIEALGLDPNGRLNGVNVRLQAYDKNLVPTDENERFICQDWIEPQEAREIPINGTNLRLRLEPAERLLNILEGGISDAMPDGHISVVEHKGKKLVYFQAWTNGTDSPGQKSGLSVVSNLNPESLFRGIYTDQSGLIKSVLKGANTEIPGQSQYAAVSSVAPTMPDGSLIMAVHGEKLNVGCRAGTSYSQTFLATSKDGYSFETVGPIIVSPYDSQPVLPCAGQGIAHAQLFLKGRYIYAIYDRWLPNHHEGGFALARAHIDNPTEFKNFHEGGFVENAIKGRATILLPRTGLDNIWFPSIIETEGGYLLTYTDFKNEVISARFSNDLIKWNDPTVILEDSDRFGFRYPTMIGEQGTDFIEKEGILVTAGFRTDRPNNQGVKTRIKSLAIGMKVTLIRN